MGLSRKTGGCLCRQRGHYAARQRMAQGDKTTHFSTSNLKPERVLKSTVHTYFLSLTLYLSSRVSSQAVWGEPRESCTWTAGIKNDSGVFWMDNRPHGNKTVIHTSAQPGQGLSIFTPHPPPAMIPIPQNSQLPCIYIVPSLCTRMSPLILINSPERALASQMLSNDE